MRLGSVAHLYRVRLRARLVLMQELFALGGIAVGVALLFAAQVASASLNGSVRQLTSEIVGDMQFQLDGRGAQGLEQRFVADAQRLSGVRAVLPVLEADANLVGPAGQRAIELIGTDPRLALHDTTLFRNFSNERLEKLSAIALPAPVAQAIGSRGLATVKLEIGSKDRDVIVGAELNSSAIGALVDSPVAVAPLSYAQQLTGMQGRISRLYVATTPGSEQRVRAGLMRLAAGSLNVEPADFDARLFAVAAAPANQGEGLFAAISALVGFMFALNAMLLTLDLRRRLVRELRYNGATRRDVLKTLAFDALVLGTLSSVLGLALGDGLSLAFFRANPGYLAFAFPLGSERIVSWQSVAIAVSAGFLAASVGVLMSIGELWRGAEPARERQRATRRPNLTASAVVAGIACLAATTIILLAAPQSAVLGSILLVVALLLLLPVLLDAALTVVSRVPGPLNTAAARVAIIELRAPSTRARSIAIAAMGAIAVFGSVAIQGAHANLQHGLNRLFHEVTASAPVWVAAPGPQNLLATAPFSSPPPGVLARLRSVGSVDDYYASFLNDGDRRTWVLAPSLAATDAIPPTQVVSGDLATARKRLTEGGWAVISNAIALEHHLRIGQQFTLPAPRPTRLRVAATITNLGWPPGAVILNPADYVHAWMNPDPSAYAITPKRGVSSQRAKREVQRALGSRSALVVQTSRERETLQQAASRQGLSRLTQIAILVLIATVLAMSIAMGTMIWQRRPRLARMKVDAYETKTLWWALVLESGLLLGAGCLIGAAFGMFGQLLISHALATVTGFPVVYSAGALAAIGSFALVSLVAVAVVAIPGYRAANVAAYA